MSGRVDKVDWIVAHATELAKCLRISHATRHYAIRRVEHTHAAVIVASMVVVQPRIVLTLSCVVQLCLSDVATWAHLTPGIVLLPSYFPSTLVGARYTLPSWMVCGYTTVLVLHPLTMFATSTLRGAFVASGALGLLEGSEALLAMASLTDCWN